MSGGPVIARGAGRAYGDAAVSLRRTVQMDRHDRMLDFDAETGLLVAEAGVTLGQIIDAFLPRGWFPAVTPGTRFVTLGGAIAADVHGKNHHRDGAFRSCVAWLDLVGPDGTEQRCSSQQNADLFDWTLGGMGLTGIVTRAAIRLRRVESAWIAQKTIPCANLTDTMAAFEANADATYSVAWIDCLATGAARGRSLLMLGEHATAQQSKRRNPLATPKTDSKSVPFDLPGWALNGLTVKAFNAFYWRKGKSGPRQSLVDWQSFFYPLDAILGWNRIYGRKGFVQFQCALPLDTAQTGLEALLDEIAAARAGSFLAVLKRLGPGAGKFSFPMEGYTLALDFPVSDKVLALLERLDAITIAHGGRFYLAKDARMKAATLRAADPRADNLKRMRDEMGLSAGFRSAQSERLAL